MKIYTKKGDEGMTGLIGGTRVSKGGLRIESYGTIDELNSHIGLLRDECPLEEKKAELIQVQDRLFTIGSHLANDEGKSKMELPKIFESDVDTLESGIDAMDEKLDPMKFFVLPGGNALVSKVHIARCVCRRAERLVVALSEEVRINELILPYLNRLSDYLFVYARFLARELNADEIAWVPRKG